jgi:hypothetical protein
MKSEIPWLYSQKPATGLYPEPDESSVHPAIYVQAFFSDLPTKTLPYVPSLPCTVHVLIW